MKNKTEKSLFRKITKIVLIALLSIVLLFIVVVVGVNIFKHFYYDDYFNSLTKVGKIAGLNDGLVPQGLTYYEDFNNGNGGFISAGYMSDNSVSRIYAVDDKTGEKTFYTLQSNGQPFYGHTGGLQYESGNFYLADETLGLYVFSSSVLDNAKSGDSLEIGQPVKLINNCCFVFSQPGYLYVGEFNNDEKYKTNNHITYNGKTNKAIVTKYKIDDLQNPIAVYSIPNEIQGFVITEEGKIVLSRSFSVPSSNFLIYEPEDIIKTEQTYAGVPVYFLGEPTKNITAPCMSEDMDLYKNKVITHFESSCNKYFFGKLFFSNYIAGLDF